MKAALPLLFCCVASAQTPDMQQITALAKTYFRDSAELPMNVSFTKKITRPDGTLQRQRHANLTMLFHGYRQNGGMTVSATGGIFQRGVTLDSMSADFAAFAAGRILLKKDDTAYFDVRPRPQAGDSFLVTIEDTGHPPFKLISDRVLFPPERSFCGTATFTLSGNPASGPHFTHFTWTASNLPANATIADLGSVQILTYKIDEDFQTRNLRGETTPFVLPKTVHIQVATDKGQIDITDEYTPQEK